MKYRGWIPGWVFFMIILAGILILSVNATQTAMDAVETTAQSIKTQTDALQINLNIVWTCMAAFLVFFMQAGFAMVEVGFTRAKNAVNIIMKNLLDFAIGSLGFFMIGFGLMFGISNGLFGTTHLLTPETGGSPAGWIWTFLIFQTVFAGTAATIVSGAMAERTKFVAYLMYTVFITTIIYPVFGSWVWGSLLDGQGWLESLGFIDFAGSTVVHSIGGWLALAGAIHVGPRIGKYGPGGKARAIPGHNISLAALGVFILWFGWFGFNPGSTTVGDGNIGRIAIITNLSAATGTLSAMASSWILGKKPDGSMSLNGALAGLVGITAGCSVVSPIGAIWIGFIAGILVVLSVLSFDNVLKVDDPVGAISVHGVCGAFGTIAVGIFATDGGLFYGGGFHLLSVQAVGVIAAFVWAFGFGYLLFYLIKKIVGIRVTGEEELSGLDIGEHGMEAYNGFQIFTTQ